MGTNYLPIGSIRRHCTAPSLAALWDGDLSISERIRRSWFGPWFKQGIITHPKTAKFNRNTCLASRRREVLRRPRRQRAHYLSKQGRHRFGRPSPQVSETASKTMRALFLKTGVSLFFQAVKVRFWDGPKNNARIVFQNGLSHIRPLNSKNNEIIFWEVTFHCLFS